MGDLGSIPGSVRSPGEGNGHPLQYSCLENPLDQGVWWATVHGVAKSWTWLSDFSSPLLLGRKVMTNLDSMFKSRHYFANKGWSSQGYGFSSGHVWMWELDCEESWMPKNWCFWTVVLEKTLESPMDNKEIKPVNPKGNKPWLFIARTDAEADTPILWPPDATSQLIRKDPDAGKDWRQEEKGTTKDVMVGWHHWLNGHEFEQALGDDEEQGHLGHCSPWGCRVGHDWGTTTPFILLHFLFYNKTY